MTGNKPGNFTAADTVWPALPVEQVSWNDCQEFCATLAKLVPGLQPRLPTEAEWEYAIRAGVRGAMPAVQAAAGPAPTPFIDPRLHTIGWYIGNSGFRLEVTNAVEPAKIPFLGPTIPDGKVPGRKEPLAATHRVKQLSPNAWGIYDGLGNVWEWCQDSHVEQYPTEAAANVDPLVVTPTGPKVVRGGCWGLHTMFMRHAARGNAEADVRSNLDGFRLALGVRPTR